MNEVIAYFMMLGAVSTGPDLAFWANANRFGIYPDSNGAIALFGARSEFDRSRDFHFRAGLSMGMRYDRQVQGINADKLVLIDEAYAGIGWKMLTLDIGMKHPDLDYYGADRNLGSLSATGGHLSFTGNSRSLPGYSLILEPVAFPWTKNFLWFWGLFGDYFGADNPYTDGRLYHRTKLFTKVFLNPSQTLSLTLGIDHYALWGGVSGQIRYNMVTFPNYLRMLLGRGADASGTMTDRLNVLGDQGGSETIRLDYKGRDWNLSLQHEIPYSDRSGMRFENFPDGVNTLAFGFDDKDRWFTDIVYEFYWTMYQSGPIQDPDHYPDGTPVPPSPDKNFNGLDNYWNNSEYRSGWTYYNRPITCPLFFPAGTRTSSVSRYALNPSTRNLGVAIENNRIIAHHLGIGGKLFRKAPYRLMLTFSQNYGTYSHPYAGESQQGHKWGTVKETPLLQFSLGFTGEIPDLGKVKGLDLLYGLYGDAGEVLKNNFSATLGLRYRIRPHSR